MVSCIVILIVDSPTTSTCELWLAWLVQESENSEILLYEYWLVSSTSEKTNTQALENVLQCLRYFGVWTTVTDRSMNHPKWKINVTHVGFYFGFYFLISFTDIYPKSTPQNFRINYEHLPELDAKQHCQPPESQNRPMNHLLKMVANVELFPFLLYFGMPWHAKGMLRKPQVHWHSVEAGNTEVNLWETCIAMCPN